jgi:hypothetical protein
VTVHFGQGGGPSTLQDAGFERSHPGVAVGVADATLDLFAPPLPSTLDLLFSLPTAARGRSIRTINKIVTAIFLSFIKLFVFQTSAAQSTPRASDAFGKEAIFPRREELGKIPSDNREYHNE